MSSASGEEMIEGSLTSSGITQCCFTSGYTLLPPLPLLLPLSCEGIENEDEAIALLSVSV
jgi:hypothetical protein